MKKVLVFLVSVFFVVSCSKGPKKVDSNLKNLPEWVSNPEVKDGIGAVGIASSSSGGLNVQIRKAELDGRANIANKIYSEISRISKQSFAEAKVNNSGNAEEVFEQGTKEVVKNVPLSNVKRIAIYQDKDNNLYVHMVLRNEDLSPFIESSEKMMRSRINASNLSQAEKERVKKTSEKIFDELKEDMGK